jgi:NhaA family Na+:H+ antiporter
MTSGPLTDRRRREAFVRLRDALRLLAWVADPDYRHVVRLLRRLEAVQNRAGRDEHSQKEVVSDVQDLLRLGEVGRTPADRLYGRLTGNHELGLRGVLPRPLARARRRPERRALGQRRADGDLLPVHRAGAGARTYVGELSDFRNALLPIFAALGGICLPALIHFTLNRGTPAQAGVGIPMATDIAFALGVLALLGSRVPASLKVFLTALAVMDDLGAIIVIAVFYTAKLSLAYLVGALAVFGLLVALNRVLRVMSLIPYLAGGALMWFLMLKSGVHATIAGVLLAFAIPFTGREDDEASPSHRLEHFLHRPAAFLILPVFALANTGIVLGADAVQRLTGGNSLGIIAGLFIGKPAGITLLSFAAVAAGVCRLPLDLNWKHVFGAGLLGGIGFTMSIFITNLAFAGNAAEVNASKTAILLASLAAGACGFLWLKLFGGPEEGDDDMDAMDFEAAPDGENWA